MKPFAYEIRRVTTLRSTWVLTSLAIVFSLFAGWLAKPITEDRGTVERWASVFTIGLPSLIALFCAFIGVFAFGHEYRYGTIRPSLTALPRRVPFAIAKIAVAAAFSALLCLVCTTVTFGFGSVFASGNVDGSLFDTVVLRTILGASLYAIGFSLLGAGLTALFRNQIVSIVLLIVVPLIVESALTALIIFVDVFKPIRNVVNYLPFSSGRVMYMVENANDVDDEVIEGFTLLNRWQGGVVYFAWAAVICALGIWRFNRSDA
jgi:ABC-2 type transport system permease protein